MGFPLLRTILGRKKMKTKISTKNSESPEDFTVDEVRKDYGVELDESQM